MRYRPFGNWGISVSALSLRLSGARCGGRARDWTSLLHAAFENGVNAFELVAPTPALLEGLAEALQALERRLVFIGLRITAGAHAEDIFREVDETIGAASLDYLDLVSVDGDSHPSTDAVWMLEELRATPKVKLIGVFGETDAVIPHVQSGSFDVLAHPFNVVSGWRERLRVRQAVDQGMCVIGLDSFPEEVRPLAVPAKRKGGWFTKPEPLAGAGSYAFLSTTHGWTPEFMCLGFALTEPALATVLIEPEGPEHVALLAAITERDLPAATGAQIEMARFSAERRAGTERRSA